MQRASKALGSIILDVESTTLIRANSRIEEYPHWGNDGQRVHLPWPPDDSIGGDAGANEDELILAVHFGGHSFSVSADLSTAEIAADIACKVQDDVIREIGSAWPPCPGHQHPMSSMVSADVAFWRCPWKAGGVVPIGQLGGRPN